MGKYKNVKLAGDLDVGSSSIVSASNGDIAITPNGSGDLVLDGFKFPQADGLAGQSLQTDGSNQGSWGTVATSDDYTITTGITASTTQSQGQQPLTSQMNIITVCATINDVVTLPTAAPGVLCIVVNKGAQTLQIFPASGDDLGAGVDTATTLAAGSNVEFVAYNTINWFSRG